MSELIRVISPDGKAGTVPANQVEQAVAEGYRVETAADVQAQTDEAAYGGTINEITAGGFGALRGATLGLSDAFLTKTGQVRPEDLAGLERVDPAASVGGELLGTAASLMVPGAQEVSGPALAAKAGVFLEKAALGTLGKGMAARAGAKALGAGFEGSLYGLGGAIGKAAKEDTELTGEKLAAGAGTGLLWGAGAGGGFGALEGAFARRAAKLGAGAADDAAKVAGAVDAPPVQTSAPQPAGTPPAGPKLPGLLEDAEAAINAEAEAVLSGGKLGTQAEAAVKRNWPTVSKVLEALDIDVPSAEGWVLRDLDMTAGQMKALARKEKFNPNLKKEGARALLDDPRYRDAKTLPEKAELLRTKADEAGKEIGDAIKAFDGLEGAGVEGAEVAARLREEIVAPLQKGPEAGRSIAEAIEKEAIALEERGLMRMSEAEEFKRSLSKFSGFDAATPAPVREAYQRMYGVLNDSIEKKAQALTEAGGRADIFENWQRAKARFAQMAELAKKTGERAEARSGNRFFSLTDNIAGAAGFAAGGPLGMAGAAAAAIANKFGRERVPQIIALHLDALRKGKGAIPRAAKALMGEVEEATAAAAKAAANVIPPPGMAAPIAAAEALAQTPGKFGRFRGALANAAARGTDHLWATHVALAESDDEYREELQRAGFTDEPPDVHEAVRKRADRLDALADVVGEQDRAVDVAVRRFFGTTPGPAPARGDRLGTTREERLEKFQERFDKLNQLVSSPEAMTAQLGAGADLSDTAPTSATSATMALQRAAQFLHAKAPKSPHGETVPALRRPWRPSEAELGRWERYAEAIDDPKKVLGRLRQGNITREAVEALEAVYPKLLEDVRGRVQEQLALAPRRLTQQQRYSLSVLLGAPVGGVGDPKRLASFQQMHRTQAAAEAQRQAQAQQSQMKGTTSLATAAQRIEGRGQG